MQRPSLPLTPGQRRISPLTIENMEQQGATSHREPRSPDTTKGEVGSALGLQVPSTPSSAKVEPDAMVVDDLITVAEQPVDEPKSSSLSSPNTQVLNELFLPEPSYQPPRWDGKPIPEEQIIRTAADAAYKIRLEGVGEAPDDTNALIDVTNKIQAFKLLENKNKEGTGDRSVTPKATPAKTASTSVGLEAFPASPDVGPVSPPNFISSPFQGPTKMSSIPGTRRTSNAGSMSMHSLSAVARMPSLRRMSTADSMISNTIASATDVSVYSEATRVRFNEDDRLLEQFVSQNEPSSFVQQPADNIPIEVDEKMKHGAFSFVCSFGWTGEEKVDLEETPLSRESYIEKLDDAKDGIRFATRAIINYQNEINSRGHHKFKTQFLSHQNQACVVVLSQLDEIEAHLNEVIDEIQSFGEDDAELEEELSRAYTHALPWVKRTQRLVSEAHIFYKLNYVLGRQQKTTKVKRAALPTIPAGRTVPNSSLERK